MCLNVYIYLQAEITFLVPIGNLKKPIYMPKLKNKYKPRPE